jgi:hypothetical protein
MGIPKPKQKV